MPYNPRLRCPNWEGENAINEAGIYSFPPFLSAFQPHHPGSLSRPSTISISAFLVMEEEKGREVLLLHCYLWHHPPTILLRKMSQTNVTIIPYQTTKLSCWHIPYFEGFLHISKCKRILKASDILLTAVCVWCEDRLSKVRVHTTFLCSIYTTHKCHVYVYVPGT